MEQNRKRFGFTDWGLVAVSAIFLVGIRSLFAPCKPKADGSWMVCHWAGQAVTGVAAVLVIMSILHLLFSNPASKLGLAAGMIPVALLAAVLPGPMIHLCMMDTMRCHSVTRPAVLIVSLFLTVIAAADLAVQRKKGIK